MAQFAEPAHSPNSAVRGSGGPRVSRPFADDAQIRLELLSECEISNRQIGEARRRIPKMSVVRALVEESHCAVRCLRTFRTRNGSTAPSPSESASVTARSPLKITGVSVQNRREESCIRQFSGAVVVGATLTDADETVFVVDSNSKIVVLV